MVDLGQFEREQPRVDPSANEQRAQCTVEHVLRNCLGHCVRPRCRRRDATRGLWQKTGNAKGGRAKCCRRGFKHSQQTAPRNTVGEAYVRSYSPRSREDGIVCGPAPWRGDLDVRRGLSGGLNAVNLGAESDDSHESLLRLHHRERLTRCVSRRR